MISGCVAAGRHRERDWAILLLHIRNNTSQRDAFGIRRQTCRRHAYGIIRSFIMTSPLLTIDVAHPPRHPDQVEQDLLDAWQRVRNSSALHVLKIIHGHGSSGKGGTTRETVRNWAYRQRKNFVAVIPGEEYTLSNDDTARMRVEVGAFADPDLDFPNPGITVLWIKGGA